jgi:hypothetical protein
MTDFAMTFSGSPEQLDDPELLKSLSRKEAERFEEYLKANDQWFPDGLVKIERDAVAGYIYQKAKGHIDAFHNNSDLPEERKDGS